MRPQVIRQLRAAGKRFNSSKPSSSSSPLDNPKVQEAVASANKVYQQGAATVKRVAGPVGERVGNALGGYREPLVYNAKVFSSLCRQVYQAERLSPPLNVSDWTHAYSAIWARASNPSFWREALKNGAWAGLGVAALEAYGVFKIGEILGRRNLVGYNLKE